MEKKKSADLKKKKTSQKKRKRKRDEIPGSSKRKIMKRLKTVIQYITERERVKGESERERELDGD